MIKDEFDKAMPMAIGAATVWHKDQKYGAQPYMVHLMEVANAVLQRYGNEAYIERIVAVLHDIVEDTDYLDLYIDFGTEIGDAVMAMTKRQGEDYFEYIERVKQNPIARRVKLCDSFSNLKHSFVEGNHKRIMKYTTVLQLLEAD